MTAVGYCIQNLSAVANWVAKQRWTFLEIPAVPAADAVQPKWCWRRHRARGIAHVVHRLPRASGKRPTGKSAPTLCIDCCVPLRK